MQDGVRAQIVDLFRKQLTCMSSFLSNQEMGMLTKQQQSPNGEISKLFVNGETSARHGQLARSFRIEGECVWRPGTYIALSLSRGLLDLCHSS